MDDFQMEAVMYEWKKHIDPAAIPERWVKLLRRTHEVSCRISQSIRQTINRLDAEGPDGRPSGYESRGFGEGRENEGRSFGEPMDGPASL